MKEIWFIADLHLDPSKPKVMNLFHDFMCSIPNHLERLYILGDLFDYWLGDDWLDTPEASSIQPIIDSFLQLTEKGVKVQFLHGNRDFLLGHYFSHKTGCDLLTEQLTIDLFGIQTLILHGDSLCIDDHEYQAFRQLTRSMSWQKKILSLSIPERLKEAQRIRQISQTSMITKWDAIMDVNADAVKQSMEIAGVPLMIHGHTHRPAIHQLIISEQPARRIVLGDWLSSPSILKVSGSSFKKDFILLDGR